MGFVGNIQSFQKITGKVENVFYPTHKEIYSIIEKMWQKNNGNMEKFISESLSVLS